MIWGWYLLLPVKKKRRVGIFHFLEHRLTFRAEVLEEHSLAMNLLVYVHGEKEPAFTVRFGLLPKVETTVCIDLDWMDARELFPEAMAGALKIVCHGRRVEKEEKIFLQEFSSLSICTFCHVRIQ